MRNRLLPRRDNASVAFFIRESLARAQSLPLRDAVEYLRGLLMSCSETSATEQVQELFLKLSTAASQLEDIQQHTLGGDLSQ